ncbi:MAG: alpha/beta hydrolase [Actinomycetia bacterium]|nr:alpha/beta hydrolase [Actinomycetes bacterium]MCP4959983.1 alpha/beta hydrolase [Actinomycetes bacterium]
MEGVPEIEFAWANGARIAYQVFGSGEQTIVAVPPSAQNIEIAWERPEIRSMLVRFGSFCRYVHFDKRGTGSSDRPTCSPRPKVVRSRCCLQRPIHTA